MSEGLEGPILIHLPGVREIITMSWVVMAAIIILCAIATINVKIIPGKLQNILEWGFEKISVLSEGIIGKDGVKYTPLFLTIFLFIFFSNLLGLLPGFKSPTSSINTTAALALVVFFSTHYLGIKKKGIWGYIKHFMGPPYWLAPLFFPLHIISELARPLSLSIRLFGNIMAKEILLGMLAVLFIVFLDVPGAIGKIMLIVPLILRPAIILLGTLVSFIQALVFTSLSIIYIASAIATEEHH